MPNSARRYSEVRKPAAEPRPHSAARGYDARWRKYRLLFLATHPLCRHCLAQGRHTEATVVDHVTPHKGDHFLLWDTNNHQALCKRCHDAKTAREDGGFGR